MSKNNEVDNAAIVLLNQRLKEHGRVSVHQILNQNNSGDQWLPLTNGNTIPVEIYKSIYENADYTTYSWLLIFQRYFTNLWKLENATPQQKEMWKQYLNILFWYGSGAIHYDSKRDKYIAYGVTTTQIDENLQIEKASVWVNNLSFIGSQKGTLVSANIGTKIVYGKLNYNALPQLVTIYNFTRNLSDMLTAFKTNLVWNAKKIRYKVKNNDSAAIREEINNFNDLKSSIITEINVDGETSNKFEELRTPSGSNGTLIEEIKSYTAWFQQYIGIYGGNSNFKKERNISDEFNGEEILIQTQIIEMEYELENVIQKANDEFGTNWQVKRFSEIVKENEVELESNEIGES